VDLLTLAGSFGLFMTLFLLFLRFLPVIAIAEIKHVMPQAQPHAHDRDEPPPDPREASA
jgi:molybdopterin-containing oxidoreductase family membrane subunit